MGRDLNPAPFEITKDGTKTVATNGTLSAMVLEPQGKMWRRRAVKYGAESAQQIEWLVIELDGVRVYVDHDNIIVTKENLRP
jgi:hypothetical protein